MRSFPFRVKETLTPMVSLPTRCGKSERIWMPSESRKNREDASISSSSSSSGTSFRMTSVSHSRSSSLRR